MKSAGISSLILTCLLATTSSQAGENLLSNPSALSGATDGWDIIADGANPENGWRTRTDSVDADSSSFITSYAWCTRSQTIDLVAAGFSETFLDRSPPLMARESFKGFNNTADEYFLKVELRAADGTVLDSWEAGNQTTPLIANGSWTEQSRLFENYPAGVRTIYWEDGGKDVEFWLGHYGTLIDGAELTFVDPAPVEINLSPGSFPVDAPAGGVAGTMTTEDNEGSTHSYDLVSEAMPLTLVETGSTWSYLDDGSDQGTAWITSIFDDSGWQTGGAELGYGDDDEVTQLGGLNAHYTNYHRHTFNLNAGDLAGINTLTLRLKRDDGAVVYLNETEVVRDNMPTGTIAFDTPSAGTAADDGNTFNTYSVPANLLQAGANLLAVEIHQQSLTSSDTSFDLELIAEVTGNSYDNDLFTIDGNLLKFARPASSVPVTVGAGYLVNIRTTDDAGNTLIEQLEVSGVPAPTQAATAIRLLPAFITEGLEAGAVVGEILATDPDTGDYHTFALVGGAGSTDNALFQVQSDRLVTTAVTDDSQATRSIRLRATDRGGFSYEQALSIEVRTFNNPPTDITFSATNIERNLPAGSLIGILETVDLDNDDTYGYDFVSTPGSQALIGFGQQWRFLDDGSDQGTGWIAIEGDFDDSTWKVGSGSFGYGDAQDTPVAFGGDASNRYITTYFRRSFILQSPSAYDNYILQVLRDDGVAVYLNEVEVGRDRLVADATATDLATSAVTDADETTPVNFTVPANLFLDGTNTITAEVHQATLASSDLTFDLALDGAIDASGERYFDIVNGNEIRSNSTFENATLQVGSNISLVVSSTDAGGESTQRSFALQLLSDNPDDLDDDGLPDAWELQYFTDIDGQDDGDDSDGDGQSNLDEWLFVTLPNDAASLFLLQIEHSGAESTRLSWPSSSGRSYILQSTGAMKTGAWTPTAAGGRSGTGATMSEVVPNDTNGERQFRLMVELP